MKKLEPNDWLGREFETTKSGKIRIIEFNSPLDVTVLFLDTGNTKKASIYKARSGVMHDKTYSKKHNKRLYEIWQSMRQRCRDTNHKSYEYYGMRGISVCDEWNNFNVFAAWAYANGYQDDLTIERVDVNLGYSPDNCAWITKHVQAHNKVNTCEYGHCIEKQTSGKFSVRTKINKIRYFLGTFADLELAQFVRDEFLEMRGVA